MKIAIIGGSGYDDFSVMTRGKVKTIKTPYGKIKAKVGKHKNKDIVFLPRHGFDYSVPPHKINNRANVAALKKEKVDYIIATAASGSLKQKMKPGDLVIITDLIDFTKWRIETFHAERKPIYTDLSHPYDLLLINKIKKAATRSRIKIHKSGVYVCTEGPRFETPAEIKAFRIMGADLVGMTGAPEVILAAEAKLKYASIALVTNHAAGISKKRISAKEVFDMMSNKKQLLTKLISKTIEIL